MDTPETELAEPNFCVVPDEHVLATSLGVPPEYPLEHWHDRGETHGKRWKTWQMCGVSAMDNETGSGRYWVVTQAALNGTASLCIYQVPHWPPQPDHLMIEMLSDASGTAIGQFSIDGRKLFGLAVARAGGQRSREEVLRTDPDVRKRVETVKARLNSRHFNWKGAIRDQFDSVRTAQEWVSMYDKMGLRPAE